MDIVRNKIAPLLFILFCYGLSLLSFHVPSSDAMVRDVKCLFFILTIVNVALRSRSSQAKHLSADTTTVEQEGHRQCNGGAFGKFALRGTLGGSVFCTVD
jgi:hypothetical protein